MSTRCTVISVTPRASSPGFGSGHLADRIREDLQIDPGIVAESTVFTIEPTLPDGLLTELMRDAIADSILCEVHAGDPSPPPPASRYIAADRLPGVTDDRALTLSAVLSDLDDGPETADRLVHVRDIYWIEAPLAEDDLHRIAERVIGNPLVEAFAVGAIGDYQGFAFSQPSDHRPTTLSTPLHGSIEDLVALSQERLLALSEEEMLTIRDHFLQSDVQEQRRALGLGKSPTDVELEILAQTWSEHCKHKEFRALIDVVDPMTGLTTLVDSLFDTFIAGATRAVSEQLEAWGHNWLVKVFDDNAGVVQYEDDLLFVWKVETHNSPSALDPYGGAITGILGNNRDPFGTGIGGGRLLFNTNVLCFGPPTAGQRLLSGQLPARRILRGVRKGIEDGGNQCGIPTVNGALLFEPRYAGKPLVYCGTGSLAPVEVHGRRWWEKEIRPGDRIVMAGGRVGKDGIHGATFSSTELHESSPRSAVQIGSPITQKLLFDFLDDACRQDLVRCSTDNGAGGLSSSVGELAQLSGGAEVDAACVPLKYPGLDPWEIFVSESQERMTLAVDPTKLDQLLGLADFYEVEATDIGAFTDSGELRVRYEGDLVACLPLGFLHNGVPRKRLDAAWVPPPHRELQLPEDLDHEALLEQLLGDINLCSREVLIRQYDHEVQGATVIKPLMGPAADGPQDAAVLQPDLTNGRGIAVSCGIAPQYGDLDPYRSAAAAFDEAVRQIVAVGGRLPSESHGGFWSVNDNFCVPDSVYDPQLNPDGRQKLGALVRMCEATRDVATAYAIPLTSGKDSMKNDFRADGVTISIPPTVLFSAAAAIDDVTRTVTSDFKSPGDVVFILGETFDELGASALSRLLDIQGGTAPRIRPKQARALYEAVADAVDRGLLASCHDLSEGGLALALAECAIGGRLGCQLCLDRMLDGLSAGSALFSESLSRFVVTVPEGCVTDFEHILGTRATRLGAVTADARIRVVAERRSVIDLPVEHATAIWKSGLESVL